MAIVEQKPMEFGWRVFGFGIMALAVVNLVWGGFDPGQPVPKNGFRSVPRFRLCVRRVHARGRYGDRVAPHDRLGRRSAHRLLRSHRPPSDEWPRDPLNNLTVFGAYSTTAEVLAVAMGALIVTAANADIDAALAARLTRIAQLAFGVCAVLFGIAHFVYMNYTAPLVPKWLPPSPEFWGYATGVFHIAGGIAILTGIQARLAAILLTVMYASFTPLVHLPTLFTGHATQFVWTENALNIILTGAAWIVADSLARR